jgi:hypothetical protein
LILAEWHNTFEVVDSNSMTLLTHFKLSIIDIAYTYEIKKTQNINEYAICTIKGLYFIDIVK